jgi:hypothetical protein
MHRFLSPLLLLGLAVAIACSDANSLAEPTSSNAVDTVTLGSLEGTPISVASGYAIGTGAVRTDQTVEFEFAYNIRRLPDGTYQRVLLPRAALGLSTSSANPGLQASQASFDDIARAPSNGYTADSAVPIEVGQRYVVRSRVTPCATLGVPLYGKLEILSFQDSTVTFKVLTDLNCGYKDLLPGLPDN